MPDAYNPWGAPVFPTAADNAMQPETFVPQGVRDWTQQAAPKDYNILSQIAGSLGKALMYPGQVAQSKEPISTEDMVGPAFNLAGMLTLGAGAAPQEAGALNMGIRGSKGTAREYPVAPRSEWYGDANYENTGGRMGSMTPDEFLAQARPMKIDEVARDNIDDLKRHIESGKTLDPLALWPNGKEDGRHRAIAAKELGIDRVPVINWRNALSEQKT